MHESFRSLRNPTERGPVTRSSIASIHALGKIIAFFAADALRLTEPRSFGCGFAAPGPSVVKKWMLRLNCRI